MTTIWCKHDRNDSRDLEPAIEMPMGLFNTLEIGGPNV